MSDTNTSQTTPTAESSAAKEKDAEQASTKPAPQTFKVTNHAARAVAVLGPHGFTLRPGVNNVPAPKWEAVKGNPTGYPTVAALLLIGRDGGVTESGEGANLEGLSDLDAYMTVQAATDADQLAGWLKGENRPRIREAIESQMKKAKAAAEKIRAAQKSDAKK